MADAKYIVVAHENKEEMFIFPNWMNHVDFFDTIRAYSHGNYPGDHDQRLGMSQVVSAGFITYKGGCYGRSESLNIDSRPSTDTYLLNAITGKSSNY